MHKHSLSSSTVGDDVMMRCRSIEVSLMREYMDEQHKFNPSFQDGDSWYNEQAYRAMNQGIGRCIRHNRDYGAIILLEARFMKPNMCKKLSRWFRNCVKACPEESALLRELTEFYRRCEVEFGDGSGVSVEGVSSSQSGVSQVTVSQGGVNQVMSQGGVSQGMSQGGVNQVMSQGGVNQVMSQGGVNQLMTTQPDTSQSQPSHTMGTQPSTPTTHRAASLTSQPLDEDMPFTHLACPLCSHPFQSPFQTVSLSSHPFISSLLQQRERLLSLHRLSSEVQSHHTAWIAKQSQFLPDSHHWCISKRGTIEPFGDGSNACEVVDKAEHVVYSVMYCKVKSKAMQSDGKQVDILIPIGVLVMDGLYVSEVKMMNRPEWNNAFVFLPCEIVTRSP